MIGKRAEDEKAVEGGGSLEQPQRNPVTRRVETQSPKKLDTKDKSSNSSRASLILPNLRL